MATVKKQPPKKRVKAENAFDDQGTLPKKAAKAKVAKKKS
jgi:hypothetical protein